MWTSTHLHGAFSTSTTDPIWYRYTSPIRLTFCEYLFQYTQCHCFVYSMCIMWEPNNNRYQYRYMSKPTKCYFPNLRHSYWKRFPNRQTTMRTHKHTHTHKYPETGQKAQNNKTISESNIAWKFSREHTQNTKTYQYTPGPHDKCLQNNGKIHDIKEKCKYFSISIQF